MAPPVKQPWDSARPRDGEATVTPSMPFDSDSASGEAEPLEPDMETLAAQGVHDANAWHLVDAGKWRAPFLGRWQIANERIRTAVGALRTRHAQGESLSASETWLMENAPFLQTLSREISDSLKSLHLLPFVEQGDAILPRPLALASSYLLAVDLSPKEATLFAYCEGIQQAKSLRIAEIWAVKSMLELALMEHLANCCQEFLSHEGSESVKGSASVKPVASGDRIVEGVPRAIKALRRLQEVDWKGFFKQNNMTERVLQQDPSGAYPRMDDASQQMYRKVVEDLALQSRFSEEDVARQAVTLAMRAKGKNFDARRAIHRTHVGYYLVGAGSRSLKERIGYKQSFRQHCMDVLFQWPEVFFIVGVEITTLALVYFLLQHLGIIIPLLPGLLLLIPASHAAIGIVNHLISMIVPPRRIAKMDFSEGIPEEFMTVVAVPCLLLSEAEVRRNVETLEIRYLGNRDPHLHFALLTDSPDASQPIDEHDALVETCSNLINQLNQKYGPDQRGGFLHLHRHRTYNPSEGRWMGWERKRGKLMDLNRLLRGQFDSFPVKVGDISVLPRVRYVIALDADTKLPPGTARRLVGSAAHPLNRPVIDPETNTVVEGHTILQPRVSVSIESSRTSRLASIYSGQTGFDIYTQAISDVYQDLFGEGSFAGKGIYEVDSFQEVLGERFPTNALLSHDLIEGSYARAGLVSDVVVIDDYPSHFSAYTRRLHRWVRGDWQIMQWLLPRVPDYHGHRVHNPLTFISRWKIFDNLRRSLNDIGLFLLLILGWAVLPGGPVYWTLVMLALLLMPTYSQLLFALIRVHRGQDWGGFFRERAKDFVSGHLQVFVMLVFLPHQAIVMLDAIVRTLTRLMFTHSNMLEWETAAESELGKKASLVETYLALVPCVSLGIGLYLAKFHPSALYVASPILALWLLPDFFTDWVNRRPVEKRPELTPERQSFLRLAGLRTWRYFREFSHAQYHWLIPDNVQEDPPQIAERLSSTNLGLLLNAQLSAHELGYLTLPEYAEALDRTLGSAQRLPRHNGHFLNWYDLQTCQPLEPRYVSTADSGNLAASLWTAKQSCLGLLHEPLLPKKLWRGVGDCVQILADTSQGPSAPQNAVSAIRDLAAVVQSLQDNDSCWIEALPRLEEEIHHIQAALGGSVDNPLEKEVQLSADLAWWAGETASRLHGVRALLEDYLPWLLPEYFRFLSAAGQMEEISLASLSSAVRGVESQVAEAVSNPQTDADKRHAVTLLQHRLALCREKAATLAQVLGRIAEDADRLVDKMDFRFLFNSKKNLFSTGYNVSAGTLDPSQYDLLASEARMAVFVAAAKGDVNQDAWFQLGRPYTSYQGVRVLFSWSGTMFEYLMPALWLRSHPDTIMDETLRAAVSCQEKYGQSHGVPWGFSEAAFSDREPQGTYRYRAFGVPGIAMDPHASTRLVVSPYSSFLALPFDPDGAAQNLAAMEKMGCLGSRGFYESCDFNPTQRPKDAKYEIVRCWMAHHQAMILMALSNLLSPGSMQKWFHREARVKAAELFLHERAALTVPITAGPTRAPEVVEAQRGVAATADGLPCA